jgi:hypothetical protein
VHKLVLFAEGDGGASFVCNNCGISAKLMNAKPK